MLQGTPCGYVVGSVRTQLYDALLLLVPEDRCLEWQAYNARTLLVVVQIHVVGIIIRGESLCAILSFEKKSVLCHLFDVAEHVLKYREMLDGWVDNRAHERGGHKRYLWMCFVVEVAQVAYKRLGVHPRYVSSAPRSLTPYYSVSICLNYLGCGPMVPVQERCRS